MSQRTDVLAYLKTGRSLTPRVALDRWGIMRLAARVKELRYQGLKIDTHLVSFGRKRYASYLLCNACRS
jgi:hypothetical protein